MKKIKNSNKNSFFKKLFIKLCRIFGYEIIDQSNFTSPTLKKELDEILTVQGRKSITIPLGELKIEKKVKELKNYYNDLQISILKSDSIKNDFNLIRSAKLAILSNSTFSWWASFLSNSKKEFLVPSNFSIKEKRMILPREIIIS